MTALFPTLFHEQAAKLKVPQSWDELLQAAKALNQTGADGKPAVYGFAVPMGRALVAPQTYMNASGRSRRSLPSTRSAAAESACR